jgi:hypothetical protein
MSPTELLFSLTQGSTTVHAILLVAVIARGLSYKMHNVARSSPNQAPCEHILNIVGAKAVETRRRTYVITAGYFSVVRSQHIDRSCAGKV